MSAFAKFVLVILSSIVLGAATYFVLGIAVARFRGEGHFYSVPFGGYAVSDNALLASAGSWILFWMLVASVLLRKKAE